MAIEAPALPAVSVTVLVSRMIRLVVSSTLAVGVRVAVQVLPPSLLSRLDNVPLATLRSDRSKPDTVSLKVMVTVVVSPMPQTVVRHHNGRGGPRRVNGKVVRIGGADARVARGIGSRHYYRG